jgi:hypothetical protein
MARGRRWEVADGVELDEVSRGGKLVLEEFCHHLSLAYATWKIHFFSLSIGGQCGDKPEAARALNTPRAREGLVVTELAFRRGVIFFQTVSQGAPYLWRGVRPRP